MTPNDKLPETMQEQIKADAQLYTKDEGYQKAYIAGATAYAPWKVKYDEMKAQAQRMADAFSILNEAYNSHVEEKEMLISRYPHLFPNIDNYIKPWVAKAKEFLQQFKDGKDVGKPAKELWIQANATWNSYPNGTKAKALMGGYWIKTDHGWHWPGGSTFPTPGGDATGEICLPIN